MLNINTMGAWNYRPSERICTLGYKNEGYYPSDDEVNDFRAWHDYLDDEDLTYDNIVNLLIDEEYEIAKECYKDVKFLIDEENFTYYDVFLEQGYYDGFYINIDIHQYPKGYSQKLEMQKELTKIKNILTQSINDHLMVVCVPHWCTTWYNQKESLDIVNNNIKKERELIKTL